MNRMDKWQSGAWRIGFIGLGMMSDQLSELVHAASDDRITDGQSSLVLNIYKMAKEIVFDVDADGNVTLTPMTWLLDCKTFEYALVGVIKGTFDTDEEVKQEIVYALDYEVPIVPNNDIVAPRLEAIYADLMANGLKIQSQGRVQRFAIIERLRFDPDGNFKEDRQVVQPAEARLLLGRLREEQAQNSEVKAVLARLTAASAELRRLLGVDRRNEGDLQRCLTKYPVLLGSNYRRVMPQHRLGSDLVTDYALELNDGSVDVMEIEASTHSLYKKNGDPTVPLVHAEQQVLDWLAWLDEYSPYARTKLPGLRRACGIVVIGTRARLHEGDEERLRWRNMMYAGRLTVLTYNDLIDRCESLHKLLLNGEEDAGSRSPGA
jgi:hypothetical protein